MKSDIVKVIEECGRKTVMRDIHRPVKGVSKGWENHSLQTLIRLVKKGDEHGKAERLLLASLEITAPRYIWQEFDTYTVGVIKGNSESTMYTLLKELERAKYSTDLEYLFYIDTPVYAMDMIFDLYKMLMGDYQKQVSLIPKANLMELRFEDFEKEPVRHLEIIYKDLLQEDFGRVKNIFTKHFEANKDYHKNSYKVKRELIEKIKTEFGFYMELYGYKVPEEIEVI